MNTLKLTGAILASVGAIVLIVLLIQRDLPKIGDCYRATGYNPSNYEIVGETNYKWLLKGTNEYGEPFEGSESKDFMPGPKYGRIDCRD